MKYLISSALVIISFLGLTLLTSPVGATTTVSGEAHITSPIKPKPVIKIKLTASAKAKLLEVKTKLTTDIAVLKETIEKYETAIYDIKIKIDARKKAGITDNVDLKAKMNALMKARTQAKNDLALLLEKLAYVESKLN